MNTSQKTNWKYILIVLILAFIVGGISLYYYQRLLKEKIEISEIKFPEKTEESKVKQEKETPIFEIPAGAAGEVSLDDLKEGKNKIGDIVIEKIKTIADEDNIIFRIDDDIKVESPKYKGEGSPSSWEAFERGYTIYYKNNQIYKDTSTALDVFTFNYKNKEYIAVKICSAGTGGLFCYLSLFDFSDKENLKFLDTISADGSLKEILMEINYLVQKINSQQTK